MAARALSLLCLACSAAAGDHDALHLRADKVVVVKSERTLTLFNQGRVIRAYKVALGGNPRGPKTRQGDHKTPEGEYILDRRNDHSQVYRSIHISYPNADDRARARKLGVSPGGDIMLHGLPNGYGWIGADHRARDWTDGCIAVTNEERGGQSHTETNRHPAVISIFRFRPLDGPWVKDLKAAGPNRLTRPAPVKGPRPSNRRVESSSRIGQAGAEIAAQRTVPMDHVFST